MEKKKIQSLVICILILFMTFMPTYADTNADGDGKELETAKKGSVYKSDGVRIKEHDYE